MHCILKRSSLTSIFCAMSFAICAQFASAAETAAETQYHLGEKASVDKHYADSIGYFNKTLQLDPTYWKAYGGRGAARFNNGDVKGALSDFKTALPHFPDNQALKDLIARCENQLNGNADVAARQQAARQMLLNAQLGGDITDPGFQILMAARRRAGLNPITGMPLNGGVAPVPNRTFVDPGATASNSVNSKLEAMTKGVHIAPQSGGTAPHAASSEATQPEQSNALQDSLSMRVSSLPPPNLSSENSVPAAATESTPFAEPTAPTSSSGITLTSAAPGGSLVTSLPNRPAAPQNSGNGRRISSVNYARDPKTNMTAQDYFDRACGKDKVMDFKGALNDYDEAIKLNPNHGPAYANRGSTRFNSGDHKGALDDFNMAVELLPDNVGLRELRDRVAKNQ